MHVAALLRAEKPHKTAISHGVAHNRSIMCDILLMRRWFCVSAAAFPGTQRPLVSCADPLIGSERPRIDSKGTWIGAKLSGSIAGFNLTHGLCALYFGCGCIAALGARPPRISFLGAPYPSASAVATLDEAARRSPGGFHDLDVVFLKHAALDRGVIV
jgi:hypothetical protein